MYQQFLMYMKPLHSHENNEKTGFDENLGRRRGDGANVYRGDDAYAALLHALTKLRGQKREVIMTNIF
jgi:hypothetical protein